MIRHIEVLLQLRPWQRHGLVLTVGGLAFIMFGFSLYFAGDLSERRAATMYVALHMAELSVWGKAFIFSGLCAILSSRWPTFSSSWGYALMCGLSSGWAAMYFAGYILGRSPVSNLNAGVTWALLAFMWWAISGLRNPPYREREANEPN